ncbi:MAG: preprotein translocase subunit SecE [Oliverpabstia sp.]|nr:preprotein translocase subunit SecE [Lachnospiraceae bacterium]MDY5026827.1 preprotein translocase subunit SecE [Oliverpabstia sp.]
MAESAKKDKAPKKSWIKGLKSEFNKIIWTDKKTLVRQTVAVVSITAILGVIISVLDSAVLQFINLLIK